MQTLVLPGQCPDRYGRDVHLCQGSRTEAVIPLLLRLLKCVATRAIAALVAIPVVMIGATALAFSINPEASLIGPFHVRNYWLLYELRRILLWSMPLAVAGCASRSAAGQTNRSITCLSR